MFGTSVWGPIGARVRGLVVAPVANQASIAARSYVMPSEPITGSRITSWVIGQINEAGVGVGVGADIVVGCLCQNGAPLLGDTVKFKC